MTDLLESVSIFMENMEKVDKFIFHDNIKNDINKIWNVANGYEITAYLYGEYNYDSIVFRTKPIIPEQYISYDLTYPLYKPASGYWLILHTHTEVPKLSGNDSCYCNTIYIAGAGVICNGEIADICKFSAGLYNEDVIRVPWEYTNKTIYKTFTDHINFNYTTIDKLKPIDGPMFLGIENGKIIYDYE